MDSSKDVIKTIKKNRSVIERYGVKKIGVFGSFVRSRQKKGSDIDILVEFRRGEKTFDNYMDLKFFLRKLLGRKIDLVIKESLKDRIKPYIEKELKYA